MGFEDRRRCGGHDEVNAFSGHGPGRAPSPHCFGDLLQLTATSITKASAARCRNRESSPSGGASVLTSRVPPSYCYEVRQVGTRRSNGFSLKAAFLKAVFFGAVFSPLLLSDLTAFAKRLPGPGNSLALLILLSVHHPSG